MKHQSWSQTVAKLKLCISKNGLKREQRSIQMSSDIHALGRHSTKRYLLPSQEHRELFSH